MMIEHKKLKVAVLFGGRSGEHEVSLNSARSVLAVLSPEKYDVTQIGIAPNGAWYSGKHVLDTLAQGTTKGLTPVAIFADPSRPGLYAIEENGVQFISAVDVVLPILHGTFGEDGTLQGLLELADLAYVGPGVTGSSVGMDKGIFKDIMIANGISVVASLLVRRSELSDIQGVIEKVEALCPYPVFTKPANAGSSVGVSKCRNRSDLQKGLLEAAAYDRRILVERGVDAREIEVSVLGNDHPEASIPGEVLPSREFYSYESKYEDGTSGLLIPAPLDEIQMETIRKIAIQAYQAIDCAGMARVDFLLDKSSGELFLNEVNTIPGFTQISMYPKLWEASGLPYPQLLDRLIELALERKAERGQTSHTFRRDK